MKKSFVILLILMSNAVFVLSCSAQDSAISIIRSGLLGAGAGAVGGAASGAKGGEIWKGALAGAGTNIVGGALLDVLTQQNTPATTQRYYASAPQNYVVQPQYVTYAQPVAYAQPKYTNSGGNGNFDDIFQQGYYQGYKDGYAEGYKDAMRR